MNAARSMARKLPSRTLAQLQRQSIAWTELDNARAGVLHILISKGPDGVIDAHDCSRYGGSTYASLQAVMGAMVSLRGVVVDAATLGESHAYTVCVSQFPRLHLFLRKVI